MYTTTVVTYDFHACRPLTEDSPRNLWSKDAYIHSKRLADEEVDRGVEAGIDAVYLHPSALFGAYDKDTWSKVFREIKRGLPTPFAPPGGGSVSHARPVAKAHLSAFHKGRRGQHYLLGGPDVSYLEILQEVAKLLGMKGPSMKLPDLLFRAYGWSEFLISTAIRREPMLTPHTIELLCQVVYVDSTRAIKELDYRPSTLHAMLSDCYQWMLATKRI